MSHRSTDSVTDGRRAIVDPESATAPGENIRPTEAARRYLESFRGGDGPEPYRSALAEFDDADLDSIRNDRQAALAFWSNLYNAGTQSLLQRRPDLYESPLRFFRFFRAPAVTVAGRELSLDVIEHGIVRGRRSKYGLGYLPRLPRRFERRYGIDCDPRIHFALNCGAASCPAIRSYERDRIDEQLDAATRAYLEDVSYDPDRNVARIPRVFLWYRGDFGGGSGIRTLLQKYDAIPEGAEPRLRYRSWDWSKAAGKFVD